MLYMSSSVRRRDAHPHHPASDPGRSGPRARRPGHGVHEAAREHADRAPRAHGSGVETALRPRAAEVHRAPGRHRSRDPARGAPPGRPGAHGSPPPMNAAWTVPLVAIALTQVAVVATSI